MPLENERLHADVASISKPGLSPQNWEEGPLMLSFDGTSMQIEGIRIDIWPYEFNDLIIAGIFAIRED